MSRCKINPGKHSNQIKCILNRQRNKTYEAETRLTIFEQTPVETKKLWLQKFKVSLKLNWTPLAHIMKNAYSTRNICDLYAKWGRTCKLFRFNNKASKISKKKSCSREKSLVPNYETVALASLCRKAIVRTIKFSTEDQFPHILKKQGPAWTQTLHLMTRRRVLPLDQRRAWKILRFHN